MLTEIAYAWPITTTLDIYFHYLRKEHIEQKLKKMFMWKIKCSPSWDTNAGTPLMINTPFPSAEAILTHCVCAGPFFWNIEEM